MFFVLISRSINTSSENGSGGIDHSLKLCHGIKSTQCTETFVLSRVPAKELSQRTVHVYAFSQHYT